MAIKSHVLKALELASTELNRMANVVGLGVVPLNDEKTKELALGVYVSKKLPKKELKQGELLPESIAVPLKSGTVDVPIRVIEQGEVTLEKAERL